MSRTLIQKPKRTSAYHQPRVNTIHLCQLSDAILLKACIASVTTDPLESCVFCDIMAAGRWANETCVRQIAVAAGEIEEWRI